MGHISHSEDILLLFNTLSEKIADIISYSTMLLDGQNISGRAISRLLGPS